MKFGIRECANIVFRAKQKTKIGQSTFEVGQPVLYIDSAKTSTVEQATSTSYAQGGRGNTRLIAWEGDKTLTFTVEDALLSPIGFAILSGAGLFKGNTTAPNGVHYHMTTQTTMTAAGVIDLEAAIATFGKAAAEMTVGSRTIAANGYKAYVCVDDAPLYIMEVDDKGSLTGNLVSGAVTTSNGYTLTVDGVSASKNVIVDYYVDLPGEQVYEADITADTFAGYYYVEADTLFRRQADGVDLPANLTFPNVKLQSNFSIAMAGSGDPSSFTFTMDAFPGYTYFDKSKKVLCTLQIVDDTASAGEVDKPVMLHTASYENEDVVAHDSNTALNGNSGRTASSNP
jgi:hypothetical protein